MGEVLEGGTGSGPVPTMSKLLGFIGATLGGALGWWVGSAVGIMTAFMVSTVASGVGLYLGRKLADHYGY